MTGPAGTKPENRVVVVLGMGNALLSDDGVGIHALAAIRASGRLPKAARLVDGGTAGPSLLQAVAGCDGLLVLDAADVGGEPGEVVRLDLHAGLRGSGPAMRTVHDEALATLLGDLVILGEFPERAVLLGVQPASVTVGTTLSPSVARAVETVVEAALDELHRWMGSSGEGMGTGNANVESWTEDDR